MRKSAAFILSAAAIVMFSNDAEARRLKLSLGKSSTPSPAVKPIAANASVPTSRSTTLIMVGPGTNQNRPFAAASRTPAPEGGPLHDLSHAAGNFAAASEKTAEPKPVEPAVAAEQQPIEPKPETVAARPATPLFVSAASPRQPAEKIVASAQPSRTVYCTVQARGGCAPF